MFRGRKFAPSLMIAAIAFSTALASADEVQLNSVTYPNQEKIDVDFQTMERAPKAAVKAVVRFDQGQASIDISWNKLEPALLFGGDVNCWVLWTITSDGATSQGELPVRDSRSGEARFSVPLKQFAMMITAEPFPMVRKPSDLIAFVSAAVKSTKVKNSTVAFNGFRAETKREKETIAALKYTDKTPVELMQARKAVEIMERFEAQKYAAPQAQDAHVALTQAEDAYQGRIGKAKDVPELSSRTMALTNEAVRAAVKQIDLQKAQQQEAKRLEELAQKQAETEAERSARMKTEADLAEVSKQREGLKAEVAKVQAQKAEVEAQREQMKQERDALATRLSNALGTVAATERTGRGLVVSMAGSILFPTGKSELKTDAKISLAKLCGILMMTTNTNIAIEGHTDSTGSAETNEKLSQARATAVMDFLKSQGVDESRMVAKGFGPAQPVADNATADGRAKNRRVEIVVPDTIAQNK